MIEINEIVLFITFLWTIYQQYSISKMCSNCKFRIDAINKKKNSVVSVQNS